VTNAESTQKVTLSSRGGATPYRAITLAATGLIVKATAGTLFSIASHNLNAAVRYLKLYDKATAATETDTPKFTIPLPTGQLQPITFPAGVSFVNGIGIRCVTELADNGTTGATASETIVNLTYK
jgi:hypothetical protein